MRCVRLLLRTSSVVLIFLLSSCTTTSDEIVGPSGPQPGGSETELIGSTGGTVSYGNAALIFEQGAIAGAESITLGIPQTEPDYDVPTNYAQIGYVYEASPPDVTLQGLVAVAFTYTDDDVGIYIESSITIWQYDELTDETTELENVLIDGINNTVSASVTQLAFYILTIRTEVNPAEDPQPPELIAPYDGQTDVPLSTAFMWDGDESVTAYHLQVAEDPNFLTLFFDFDGLTGELHGLAGFDLNTTYYWRVRSRVDQDYSDWSDPFSFTTVDIGVLPTGIEGVWELDAGAWNWITDVETFRFEANTAGNLVINLGDGTYFARGDFIWNSRVINMDGGAIVDDLTEVYYLHEG
ncbi:fibronectin type III domain-containing protein, partial [bacterium]|nr:fibronectin type III domain-containing protein [bacterium]